LRLCDYQLLKFKQVYFFAENFIEKRETFSMFKKSFY